MELLQILGWIYLGVMLGSVFGVMALSLFIGPKIKQYTIDIDDLKEEQVSGAISSGNTGALLTASLLILGKIEGIKRPALAPYIPIKGSGFILCDAGANATVKPEHLYQFAIMSSAYLEHQGLQNKPKVGFNNPGGSR